MKPGAWGSRVGLAAALALLALVAVASMQPNGRALEAQQTTIYAIYEGCIDAQVTMPGPAQETVLPLHVCIQLLLQSGEQPRVTITSLSTPIASATTIRQVVLESVKGALSRAADLLGDAKQSSGEVIYVKGAEPVVCRNIYTASSSDAKVDYLPSSLGLVPASVQAVVTGRFFEAKVRLDLTHLSGDEGACGVSLLTGAREAILKIGTLAVLVGVLASIAWRAKTKPVTVIYRYYPY